MDGEPDPETDPERRSPTAIWLVLSALAALIFFALAVVIFRPHAPQVFAPPAGSAAAH